MYGCNFLIRGGFNEITILKREIIYLIFWDRRINVIQRRTVFRLKCVTVVSPSSPHFRSEKNVLTVNTAFSPEKQFHNPHGRCSVSASSIPLCWRAAARAGSFVARWKKKERTMYFRSQKCMFSAKNACSQRDAFQMLPNVAKRWRACSWLYRSLNLRVNIHLATFSRSTIVADSCTSFCTVPN